VLISLVKVILGSLICTLPLSSSALELVGLIRETLISHPSIRAQDGLRQAASAGLDAARWQFFPTPSVTFERVSAGQDSSYSGDNQFAVFRIQQPLWSGGRITAGVSRAGGAQAVALADFELTRYQLSLRVIQSWTDANVAAAKAISYGQSKAEHERLMAMVLRRTAQGLSTQSDVNLARTRLESIEADMLTARVQLETALDRMSSLVGRPIKASELAPASQQGLPVGLAIDAPIESQLRAAYSVNPQLAKTLAQISVAEAELALAKAALSPEIFVRAERQFGNYSVVGQSPQSRFFVGATSNFGAGLSSFASVEVAIARLRAAQDDIQIQQLAIDEQLRADVMQARSAKLRRMGLVRSRTAASDVSDSWSRQFLAGRKQWQDLMNAARELAQTDAQLSDAIGAELIANWRLHLLTRGVDALLLSSVASPELVK
jgi:adhesin transport system outer membrane protein